MASQSARPRDPGNKNGALRPVIASVRRETDRNDPPGILGPNAILYGSGFGGQAPTLPGLLQSSTRALGLGRTAPRSRGSMYAIKIRFLSLAATLSRPL